MPIDPGKTRTNGVDFNFFEKLNITSTSFGDEDGYANVIITFRNSAMVLSLINEGSNVIEYSFNGNKLHGDLTPNTPSEALSFERRPVSKIWFRAPNGPAAVRVEAWALV